MSDTLVATPDDLPEVEHDPEALLKLKNAYEVLNKELATTDAAARQAYEDVWERAALTHSRFRAIVYGLLADAHSAGFTRKDVNRVLGDNPAL